jgi:DNA-binding helix-hairpin-helix protein with protein kinase domain
MVAKIYKKPSQAQAQKLRVMITRPPIDPMHKQGHQTFAWPVDMLLNDRHHVVGFLMPRVAGNLLIDVYNPKTRRQSFSWINPRFLLRTALNLASMVDALHQHGYVVGDVNASNILVHTGSQTSALVTLVDTDSLQVPDPRHGLVHRCVVGKPEFTPPELQGKRFADIDRTPLHDRFGLAVLLFQLLMEGVHPFGGRWLASGDPPELPARIKAGYFPHGTKRQQMIAPMPLALPFAVLHPQLQHLFLRCFVDGHGMPDARPAPHDWKQALRAAEADQVVCRVNAQHWYFRHNSDCPWCAFAPFLKRDPFPPLPGQQKPTPQPPSPPPPPSSRGTPHQAGQHPSGASTSASYSPRPRGPLLARWRQHLQMFLLLQLVAGGIVLVAWLLTLWR